MVHIGSARDARSSVPVCGSRDAPPCAPIVDAIRSELFQNVPEGRRRAAVGELTVDAAFRDRGDVSGRLVPLRANPTLGVAPGTVLDCRGGWAAPSMRIVGQHRPCGREDPVTSERARPGVGAPEAGLDAGRGCGASRLSRRTARGSHCRSFSLPLDSTGWTPGRPWFHLYATRDSSCLGPRGRHQRQAADVGSRKRCREPAVRGRSPAGWPPGSTRLSLRMTSPRSASTRTVGGHARSTRRTPVAPPTRVWTASSSQTTPARFCALDRARPP